jgi:hypothetical protein
MEALIAPKNTTKQNKKKIMGDRAPQQHLLALSDEEIVAPEEVIESALTVLLYEHRHW